jgi:sigma-B regulation protein RsbQ
MQCSEDIIAPLSVGEYLAREMPSSTLVVLKATGHCPHMSAPQETIDKIKQYLSKQPA